MTPEEHRARHRHLHKALDELIADYLDHQPIERFRFLSETTVMELMEWSFQQTRNPTPNRAEWSGEGGGAV